MRALGVDPGTVVTGYGLVEEEDARLFHLESGAIAASQRSDVAKRLRLMYSRMEGLVARYKPDAFVLESSFYAKNVHTTIRLGQISGVMLLLAESAGIPVYEYSPMEVKLSVVGYGAAKKEQVYQMIGHLLKMEKMPDSHHATDALAVAVCHLHSRKMKELSGLK
jgi:crossover junction endodeoxyribonuclease RuvC